MNHLPRKKNGRFTSFGRYSRFVGLQKSKGLSPSYKSNTNTAVHEKDTVHTAVRDGETSDSPLPGRRKFLLKEQCSGKARITKDKKVIDKLLAFLNNI